MTDGHLRTILRQLRRLAGAAGASSLSDSELLERFLTRRDEAAFEVLVWRHGPMVLNLCRRLAHHEQDAEDAFQATFLALVRKAASIRQRTALGSWLYQVAYRAALAAKAAAVRHAGGKQQDLDLAVAAPGPDPAWSDLRPVLDAEVDRLPEKYRVVVVLCYLEGLTVDEAARQLGWPRGTVATRLAWARERLRARLTHRGLTLSAGLLATALSAHASPAAVPAPLVASTVKAALLMAANRMAAAGWISAPVAALLEGVLQAMWLTKLKTAAAVVLCAGVLGAAALGFTRPTLEAGETAPQPEVAAKGDPVPFVYALLQVAKDEPRVLSDSSRPKTAESDFDTFRRTQAMLVKSRLVLNTALRQPRVAELAVVKRQADPWAWLENSLQVDFPNQAEILRVGLRGEPTEQLAVLVDAVVDAYLQEFVSREHRKRTERLEDLKELRNKLQDELRKKRSAVRKIMSTAGLDGSGTGSLRQQHLLQELTDCTRELRRARLAKAAAQVRLARQQADKQGRAEAAPDAAKLAEEVAVLAEQEKLLTEEEKRLLALADKHTFAALDLEEYRQDITLTENLGKRAMAEVEALSFEIGASPRTRLLQTATVAKPK